MSSFTRNLMIQSDHKFVHGSTAELPWDVQICRLILSLLLLK